MNCSNFLSFIAEWSSVSNSAPRSPFLPAPTQFWYWYFILPTQSPVRLLFHYCFSYSGSFFNSPLWQNQFSLAIQRQYFPTNLFSSVFDWTLLSMLCNINSTHRTMRRVFHISMCFQSISTKAIVSFWCAMTIFYSILSSEFRERDILRPLRVVLFLSSRIFGFYGRKFTWRRFRVVRGVGWSCFRIGPASIWSIFIFLIISLITFGFLLEVSCFQPWIATTIVLMTHTQV